jgi:AraC family transcriptional regulator
LEKIAVARGEGWNVSDIVCSAGPRDPRFEEQHTCATIALVISGSFQYRTAAGRAVMTPGSLLLGNPGHHFECGHEHAVGDHCISFQYHPSYFGDRAPFPASTRIPPLRSISALTSRVRAALAGSPSVSWEELAVSLGGMALETIHPAIKPSFDAESRVTRVVRMLDAETTIDTSLENLAQVANLSPYHFIRTFQNVTGVTPHQYVLRMRLRLAAVRLATQAAKVIDVALESGFRDVSNFNRTFRAEFGVSPRTYRRQFA